MGLDVDVQEWSRFLKYLSENAKPFYYPYRVAGGRMFLDITESPMMLRRALGRYEVAKHRLLAAILRLGDVMIDVGANKGDFSLLAARCVGTTGDVLAFEPEPDNCRWIDESVKLNEYRNVRIMQAALSDRNGTTTLYLGKKSGWHSLKPTANTGRQSITVPQTRLDDFLREKDYQRPIRAIKIDVEGLELEVLKGAADTLKRNDVTLVIDLHPHLGVDVPEVASFLRTLGFQLYREEPTFWTPVTALDGLNSIVARKSLR